MNDLEEKASESWLVSVIVPVFNVQSYLVEALDSAIHQTYQNLEIIIVDDGSTDGSSEICKQYAATDKRIKLVHQENQGLSSARNTGLDIMTGRAVAFLDSDDAFCPDMIEIMLKAMQQNDADIVVGKYVAVETSEQLTPNRNIRPFLLPGIYIREEALRFVVDEQLNIAVWNKLYRTELWEDIRFPAGRVYEDWSVIFPIINKTTKVYAISDIVYLYRIRHGSISMTSDLKKYSDWTENYSAFESFAKQHKDSVFADRHIQIIRERNIYETVKQYIRYMIQGNSREEQKIFRKQILKETRGIRIHKPSTWCAYQLLRFFPGLLRIAFKTYDRIHDIRTPIKHQLSINAE